MKLAGILLAAVFATASCQTTTPVPERFPAFEGSIIPIELPFQPQYRHHKSSTKLEAVIDLSAGNDKLKLNVGSLIDQAIRESGGKLEWTANIREMTLLGRKVRARSPLMTARWLTTIDGSIEGFEMAFPGMKEIGLTDVPDTPKQGTPEYSKFLQQFGAGAQLPTSGVVTGSVLFKQKLADLLSEIPGIDSAQLGRDVGYVVKGWGYYGNRKVLVTEQEFDAPAGTGSGDRTSVSVAGYTLFDADTMARVKSDMAVVISGTSDGKPMFVKFRGIAESTITE